MHPLVDALEALNENDDTKPKFEGTGMLEIDYCMGQEEEDERLKKGNPSPDYYGNKFYGLNFNQFIKYPGDDIYNKWTQDEKVQNMKKSIKNYTSGFPPLIDGQNIYLSFGIIKTNNSYSAPPEYDYGREKLLKHMDFITKNETYKWDLLKYGGNAFGDSNFINKGINHGIYFKVTYGKTVRNVIALRPGYSQGESYYNQVNYQHERLCETRDDSLYYVSTFFPAKEGNLMDVSILIDVFRPYDRHFQYQKNAVIIFDYILSVPTCDLSCQKCKGPTPFDCIECADGAQFELNGKQNLCLCNEGKHYFQVDQNLDNRVTRHVCESCLGDRLQIVGKYCLTKQMYQCSNGNVKDYICRTCVNRYYIYEGLCQIKDTCPSFTYKSGNYCVEDLKGKYTMAKDFRNPVLAYKFFYNDDFDMHQLRQANMMAVGFKKVGTYCNGRRILGGFGSGKSRAGISVNLNISEPHSQILIAFTWYKIDDWNNNRLHLHIDGTSRRLKKIVRNEGSNICGFQGLNDHEVKEQFLFEYPKQNEKFNLTITSGSIGQSFLDSMGLGSKTAAWGISDLVVIIDKCESNTCKRCNRQGQCLECVKGYKFRYENGSYKNYCEFGCPRGYYMHAVTLECEKCHHKCAECIGFPKCTKCKDGLFVFNNDCVEECPYNYGPNLDDQCVPCSEFECRKCLRAGQNTYCPHCNKNVFPQMYLYSNHACQKF